MHRPVMLKEVISSLNLKSGYKVLDATIGLAGHACEIVKRIGPGGHLVGLDADAASLEMAESALKEFPGRFTLVNENFINLDIVLSKIGIKNLDAVLFDLGISSYQLDNKERGFSIRHDGPLDMRMDHRLNVTAYDIVNKFKEKALSEIIEKFGEERLHNRIARYIVEARTKKPIKTTHELTIIIHRAFGGRFKRGRIDPATRTFQAIRIVVNNELSILEEGLKKAISYLDVGARICVISFHSLEDRIVKNLFRGYSRLGVLKVITKKPVRPSCEEAGSNPRSRSARLRVAERI